MTSEKRKAILTLTITLIVGILLGVLIPGLFHKMRERGYHGQGEGKRNAEHKREWFTATIDRIIQPDSVQALKIKPITRWASDQIDSLEAVSNDGLATVLDSVKKQMKPLITPEQFKRLDEFDAKAKGRWHGRGRR